MSDVKDQVKDATDIVQLIGEHVRLIPKGREFVCLCPFHDDKNPSMCVIPNKQIYHCFVCGASGDAFTFMMKYHRMDFPEALKSLAERVSIALPEKKEFRGRRSQGGTSDKASKQELRDANELAQKFFVHHLGDMAADDNPEIQSSTAIEAREYVRGRQISLDMIKHFQVGYAPDSWDELVKAIEKRKLALPHFEAAGLVAKRKQGPGFYDKLRHRLIFPIHDNLGRVIGFGARKLRKEDEPKYLNSPETALFHKSNTLYGIHQASRSIIDSKTAIVVEGYTDVIACHQAGFTQAIAALGTAFTAQHARQLQQKAEKIILLFDADEAGLKAADRAVEVFFKQSMDVHVAVLPEGKDPADMLTTGTDEEKEAGKVEFQKYLDEAKDAMTFLLERLKKDMKSINTMSGQEHRAEDFLRKLSELGITQASPVRKAMIVSKLANMLHLPEDVINKSLAQKPGRPAPRTFPQPRGNQQSAQSPRNPGNPGSPRSHGSPRQPQPQSPRKPQAQQQPTQARQQPQSRQTPPAAKNGPSSAPPQNAGDIPDIPYETYEYGDEDMPPPAEASPFNDSYDSAPPPDAITAPPAGDEAMDGENVMDVTPHDIPPTAPTPQATYTPASPTTSPLSSPPAMTPPATNMTGEMPANRQSDIAERDLLGCLMNDPRLIEMKVDEDQILHHVMDTEDFLNPHLGELYGDMLDGFLNCDNLKGAAMSLIATLQEKGQFEVASQLLSIQAQINQRISGKDDATTQAALEKLARDATHFIRQSKASANYLLTKEELAAEEEATDSLLRIVQEHNKSAQNPRKFPRPR